MPTYKTCLQLRFLKLNSPIEFLNGILEALLIQEDFAAKKGSEQGMASGTMRPTSSLEVRYVEGSAS